MPVTRDSTYCAPFTSSLKIPQFGRYDGYRVMLAASGDGASHRNRDIEK
jgi:hypothetical protein